MFVVNHFVTFVIILIINLKARRQMIMENKTLTEGTFIVKAGALCRRMCVLLLLLHLFLLLVHLPAAAPLFLFSGSSPPFWHRHRAEDQRRLAADRAGGGGTRSAVVVASCWGVIQPFSAGWRRCGGSVRI